VKSLDFEVQTRGDDFKLVGRGFGHGAGLCQWGAKLYAEREGWDYRKILEHYYPGAQLQQMY
jgi:stage II sporulation protein D